MFECKVGTKWEGVGYIVHNALEVTHEAMHKDDMIVQFDWVKYIVQFK